MEHECRVGALADELLNGVEVATGPDGRGEAAELLVTSAGSGPPTTSVAGCGPGCAGCPQRRS
eukprot:2641478-Alexandrium_andersonii.AAC.1